MKDSMTKAILMKESFLWGGVYSFRGLLHYPHGRQRGHGGLPTSAGVVAESDTLI